jgi:hypothetical protein
MKVEIPKEEEATFLNQILLIHVKELRKTFKFGKLTILINGIHGPECEHSVCLTDDTPDGIRACADILQEEMEALKGEVN